MGRRACPSLPAAAAAVLLVVGPGCGERAPADRADQHAPDAGTASARASAADVSGEALLAFQLPPYPPHVRSLRLRRSIAVRLDPTPDAKRLGTVAQDTRVGYRGSRVAPGCETRWIEIEPRGWVCEALLEPTTRPPDGVELPRLARGELVPGSYGKLAAHARILTLSGSAVTGDRALAGAATVRRYDERIIRGAAHWRIGPAEWVRASLVEPHEPSAWHGTRLGDDTGLALPLGFAIGEKNGLGPVPVYAEAEGKTELRRLERRTRIHPLETVAGADGLPSAYRIGDGEWLRAADVRLAERTAPPPTTEPGERWIDIDLDRQVLVAYEGDLPVYVTMVSSGKKKTPTATGIFRIWIKFAETDMSGQMPDEEAYTVATVPWTQFYAKDLALHTTYWHDKLGLPRSHGCVNLAPIDARFLYYWSAPDVPPGWSMANGVVERPGSMVRVRSLADPSPAFQGYAMRVYEARKARSARSAQR
ncbi:MAG TPA: L,D-transpeptidase [Kofleriaceae bacterium]|nr:L,D-transpeptidase [Kofleriaceae bacterium]